MEQGTYTVSFGDIVGYITPSPLSIIINSGFVAIVTVEYIKL